MIDFKATYAKDGLINFCNSYNETLKSYPISKLEQYVIDNKLNIRYGRHGIDALHFNKFTQNHIAETSKEVEVWQPVSEYIDENFEQLTKDFYISLNPTEHKANNTPQKTLRQVG